MKLGDLTLWGLSEVPPDAKKLHIYEVGQSDGAGNYSPAAFRLDFIADGSADIYYEIDGFRYPAGSYRPHFHGVYRLECVTAGKLSIIIVADPGTTYGLRKYGAANVIESQGDVFTTFDPSNFVDNDVDRMQRLMAENQLRMMAAIEAKYDSEIAKLREMSRKEAPNEKETVKPEDSPAPLSESGETPQDRTPPPTGQKGADVK